MHVAKRLPPFGHLTAWTARDTLKTQLAGLGVADAGGYWLHDFRRGHTHDLLTKGATLADILRTRGVENPRLHVLPGHAEARTGCCS